MLFHVRHLCVGVLRSRCNFKPNAALLQLSHNLKNPLLINTTRIYSTNGQLKLSLTNESTRKYIQFVINAYEKNETLHDDLVSKQTYIEMLPLLRARLTVEQSMKSLEELGQEDPEMKKLGEEEYSNYKKELETLDEELLNSILSNIGREISRDIILEITTGVGGQEAMLFAKDLFDMYLGYLEYLGFQHEVLHQDDTMASDGIRHASIAISGDRALEIFRHEGGVHRVQRIPVTERSGRIHTSTVSVALLPQPTDIEVNLQKKDLKIETKKASGAGGQHVNTTDSAVRITHLPSGISIESQESRSQIKNRSIAMLRLRLKLYEKELTQQREATTGLRKKQFGLGQRNEKIRTYNFNQDRITDHRLDSGTSHNLKGFLEGGQGLQELHKKLQRDLQMKLFQQAIQKVIK